MSQHTHEQPRCYYCHPLSPRERQLLAQAPAMRQLVEQVVAYADMSDTCNYENELPLHTKTLARAILKEIEP